jgi:hypothetical protein
MKTIKLTIAMLFLAAVSCLAQTKFEFTQMTTIESVVPAGLGRSRMITTKPNGEMDEVKMENFFSAVGINFSNVRSNDKLISDKITQLSDEGWELVSVTPGVYASESKTGIFITRYLFKREKK